MATDSCRLLHSFLLVCCEAISMGLIQFFQFLLLFPFPTLVTVAQMASKMYLCQVLWQSLLLLSSYPPPLPCLIGLSIDGLLLRPRVVQCHRYYVNSELISVFVHRIIVRKVHRDHVVYPLERTNWPWSKSWRVRIWYNLNTIWVWERILFYLYLSNFRQITLSFRFYNKQNGNNYITHSTHLLWNELVCLKYLFSTVYII